jgi:hypothetical protein
MPPRLHPDIATTATNDGLVLLDERTGRYWQLNPTGAHVLHALLEGHHGERIAQDLVTGYRIDPRRAQHDVTALTDHLHTANLVLPS